MIKIAAVILLALSAVAAGVSAAGQAEAGETVVIGRPSAPIQVDGDLSEWTGVKPLVVNQREQIVIGAENWQGPLDFSAEVYAVLDEQNLYVAAHVADDQPLINHYQDNMSFNGDAMELFVEARDFPPDEEEGTSRVDDVTAALAGSSGYDYQIVINSGETDKEGHCFFGQREGGLGTFEIPRWRGTNGERGKGCQVAARRVDNPVGYALEVKISLANFGSSSFEPGMRIGFDVAFDDCDDSTPTAGRKLQAVWYGTERNFRVPADWGRAYLFTSNRPEALAAPSKAAAIPAVVNVDANRALHINGGREIQPMIFGSCGPPHRLGGTASAPERVFASYKSADNQLTRFSFDGLGDTRSLMDVTGDHRSLTEVNDEARASDWVRAIAHDDLWQSDTFLGSFLGPRRPVWLPSLFDFMAQKPRGILFTLLGSPPAFGEGDWHPQEMVNKLKQRAQETEDEVLKRLAFTAGFWRNRWLPGAADLWAQMNGRYLSILADYIPASTTLYVSCWNEPNWADTLINDRIIEDVLSFTPGSSWAAGKVQAQEYLRMYRAFAPAMRKYVPQAKIGGPGVACYVSADHGTRDQWPKYLKLVADGMEDLDYWDYHWYGLVGPHMESDLTGIYTYLLRTHKQPIPILCSEYGEFSCFASRTADELLQYRTLLMKQRNYLVMLRHPDKVIGANEHTTGIIFDKLGRYRTAYMANLIFRDLRGQYVVSHSNMLGLSVVASVNGPQAVSVLFNDSETQQDVNFRFRAPVGQKVKSVELRYLRFDNSTSRVVLGSYPVETTSGLDSFQTLIRCPGYSTFSVVANLDDPGQPRDTPSQSREFLSDRAMVDVTPQVPQATLQIAIPEDKLPTEQQTVELRLGYRNVLLGEVEFCFNDGPSQVLPRFNEKGKSQLLVVPITASEVKTSNAISFNIAEDSSGFRLLFASIRISPAPPVLAGGTPALGRSYIETLPADAVETEAETNEPIDPAQICRLRNGDFETADSFGQPVDWEVYGWSGEWSPGYLATIWQPVTYSTDGKHSHSRQSAVGLIPASVAGQTVLTVPGKRYQVSFWARAAADSPQARISLSFHLYNPQGPSVSVHTVSSGGEQRIRDNWTYVSWPVTREWRWCWVEFEVPEPELGTLGLRWATETPQTIVWLDDAACEVMLSK